MKKATSGMNNPIDELHRTIDTSSEKERAPDIISGTQIQAGTGDGHERGDNGIAAQPKPQIWQNIPLLAGVSVAFIGLLVLLGWGFGLDSLRSVLPGMTSMKLNTALCFVLAGAALAFRERRALRSVCAAVIAVVSALSLIEYLAGSDLGIDQLLVPDPGDVQTVPGRMAQTTGISFILISLSLLMTGVRTRTALWLQQASALIVGALGMTALLGYAYYVRQFYGLAGFSSMALHTAVAMALLSGGLLFARSDGFLAEFNAARPGRALGRWLLPGAIVLPAIIGWLRVLGSQAGLFEPNFGAGLFAISMMFTFVALVWWTARSLNMSDAVRQETEEALRVSEERMRVTLTSIGDAVLTVDAEGRITFLNPVAEALTGWELKDALGQPIRNVFKIVNEQTHEPSEDIIQRVFRESRVIALANHTALVTKDGREIPIEDSAAPIIDDRGRLSGVVLVFHDVTEKRRVQEALRAGEERFRLALENSPVSVAVQDLNLVYRWAYNQQTLQPDEITGKTDSDLFAPEEATGMVEMKQQVLKSGQERHAQRWFTSNGRRMFLDLHYKPMRNPEGQITGIGIAVVDLTERKRAEEALRLSEEKFALAFANNPAAIALTRLEDGLIQAVNDTWEKLNGYGRGEVIGLSARKLHIWPTAEAADKFIQTLLEEGSLHGWEQEFFNRSGEIFVAQLSATIMDVQGEKFILSTFVDITERKKMEQELRRSHDELELRVMERTSELTATVNRLEALNQELQEFTHVTSHDLQEPLRKIQTFCDLIQTRSAATLDSSGQDYLHRVINSTLRMRQLLSDLLQLSRLTGKLDRFKKIDLGKIAREAAEFFEEDLKKLGGALEIDAMPVIDADETQMLRLFQNLIGNAMKFRDKKSPLIKLHTKYNDGTCEIHVKDNGIGFEQEYAERIFKPFQRLHGWKEYEGTGMGLAICRKIVERHGGSIRAESEPGKGSTFIITLPVRHIKDGDV